MKDELYVVIARHSSEHGDAPPSPICVTSHPLVAIKAVHQAKDEKLGFVFFRENGIEIYRTELHDICRKEHLDLVFSASIQPDGKWTEKYLDGNFHAEVEELYRVLGMM